MTNRAGADGDAGISDGERPGRRRWSFAGCVFDEANWTLIVDGRRVAIEIKPLELLRELLLHAGNLVSKDELLDAIWPDVMVVEASLPTAIRKLRAALKDDQRPERMIETVPRIGYRLAAWVQVEALTSPAEDARAAGTAMNPAGKRARKSARGLLSVAAALAVIIGVTAIVLSSSQQAPATKAAQPVNPRDAEAALRRLDVAAIERMLAAGWDPNAQIGLEGNAALHYLMEICEWNPRHDRNQLLLMARTVYEGGGRLDQRNVWGDTPYSIAKSPRYCGPDHPVTRSFQATCYGGAASLGDRCLAAYEVARRNPH